MSRAFLKCDGGNSKYLTSLIVSVFVVLVLIILLVILIVLVGVVMDTYQHLIFLTDRNHLDSAICLVEAFIVIVFLSFLLEACLW